MSETDRENVAVKENEEQSKDGETTEAEVTETEVTQEEPEAGAEDASDLEDLSTQLDEALEKADEYLDQWRRTAADFANFRKRKEREQEEFERRANERLLLKLLPVYDDFRRALENVPGHLDEEDWVGGVEMIERKFWSALEQEGVEVINPDPGEEFDPELHDALMSVETDEYDDGQIVDMFERGYKHKDRVLRAAKVRVAR